METKETKRHYERPRMTVVELQHRTMLLAGSGGFGNRNPYTPDDDNPFGG
ncbi:MAG: hypothetical protein IJ069_01585 [Prevotella sp.]|nr:hypothetical protein [Prevotella sp.]MBQ8152358.1 hypothetical protein [Prevotella sp.]